MKRFLMLVGVAVVAAAMYVAASPAGRQAKAPTAKQFNALKKQVASLSKQLKTAKLEAEFAAGYIVSCFTTGTGSNLTVSTLPVSQFGSSTSGYLFGTTAPDGAAPRTALDVNTTSPTAVLQEFNPACLSGTNALRHGPVRSGTSRLQRWTTGDSR
jgi:hypothetical protein